MTTSGRLQRGLGVVHALWAAPAVRRSAQVAVLGLAGWFLVQTLLSGRRQATAALVTPEWGAITATVALAVAAMVWIAFGWWLILRAMGEHLPIARTIGLYFVGELSKYLPGALWPLFGRAELIVATGAPRTVAYTATVQSLLLNFVLAGLAASALTAGFAVAVGVGSLAPLWLLALLPAGIAMLHPRVLERLRGLAARMTRRSVSIAILPWSTSVGLVGAYLPAWAAIGAATWFAGVAVGASAEPAVVLLAASLSWVAGFLVFPAPAGLGVREVVFAALLATSPSLAAASSVALLARLAFVVADGAGAVAGLAALRGLRVRAARREALQRPP
jgi:uncharacterized membrane protein YbhN (UPF0104 family)